MRRRMPRQRPLWSVILICLDLILIHGFLSQQTFCFQALQRLPMALPAVGRLVNTTTSSAPGDELQQQLRTDKGDIIPPLPLKFSDDPLIDSLRKKSFEKFISFISLLGQENSARFVRSSAKEPYVVDDETRVVDVNTLVFQLEESKEVVLVIAPSTEKVDTRKVEQILGCKVRLAPSFQVEKLCGFPPGSVPPIGHFPGDIRTLLDGHLSRNPELILLGGGGHPDYGCLLSVGALLQMPHVSVVDVAAVSPSETLVAGDASGLSHLRVGDTSREKPFFPISPTPWDVDQRCTEDKTAPNPLAPVHITITGRISSVRRMAKRLVFADFVPPECGMVSPLPASTDRAWRSKLDGESMAVQLIAGETLCRELGDVEGPAALRRLKPGQLVMVQGKTNLGNLDSSENWVKKRSLDILVCSYRVVEDAAGVVGTLRSMAIPKVGSGTIRSNTERRRFQQIAVPRLTLSDMLGPKASPVTVVDTPQSVNEFSTSLSQVLVLHGTKDTNETPIPGMEKFALVGVDCEWRPSFLMNSSIEPQPILLLQIYVQSLRRVYLFDMQALFRPMMDPSEPMTPAESAASEPLLNLFSSDRLLKTGFQVGADLGRLASSYPHIPAFRAFHAIVEVSTLAKKAMQLAKTKNIRHHGASLARLAEFMTGKTLDKEQQTSDWAARPLSQKQIEYASLDAVISPFLLEHSLRMAKAGIISEEIATTLTLQLGRWKDDKLFARGVLSWRFVLVDIDDPMVIRKLKAKRLVGRQRVIAQYWATGMSPPQVPFLPSQCGEDIDVARVYRVSSSEIASLSPRSEDK